VETYNITLPDEVAEIEVLHHTDAEKAIKVKKTKNKKAKKKEKKKATRRGERPTVGEITDLTCVFDNAIVLRKFH
jgi:hypothetical protein